MKLKDRDTDLILAMLPDHVFLALTKFPATVVLGGGYIRDLISRQGCRDIDLFASDRDTAARVCALILGQGLGLFEAAPIETDHAFTLAAKHGTDALSIQVVYGWQFSTPEECACGFDFTVCRAVIWCNHNAENGLDPIFCSFADDDFYVDLAARQLVYTQPDRKEQPAGSLLRVLKFMKRGFHIDAESMAGVIARLMKGQGCDEDQLQADLVHALRSAEGVYQ